MKTFEAIDENKYNFTDWTGKFVHPAGKVYIYLHQRYFISKIGIPEEEKREGYTLTINVPGYMQPVIQFMDRRVSLDFFAMGDIHVA